jgi:hypothetical protein
VAKEKGSETKRSRKGEVENSHSKSKVRWERRGIVTNKEKQRSIGQERGTHRLRREEQWREAFRERQRQQWGKRERTQGTHKLKGRGEK